MPEAGDTSVLQGRARAQGSTGGADPIRRPGPSHLLPGEGYPGIVIEAYHRSFLYFYSVAKLAGDR